MITVNEAQKKLLEVKKDLNSQYGVSTLGIFGSVVRGQATGKSDVDILVEFSKPIGLFSFIALEDRLKQLLKTDVDLVEKSALKPSIGKYILREVVYI